MMNLQQERKQIITQRVKIEQRLDELAYIDDCDYAVVDLDTAFYAINQLEQHMLLTLERISRQQTLADSKRR
jgi:hypothetical protein